MSYSLRPTPNVEALVRALRQDQVWALRDALAPLASGDSRGRQVSIGPYQGAMAFDFRGAHGAAVVEGRVFYRFAEDETALVLVDIAWFSVA